MTVYNAVVHAVSSAGNALTNGTIICNRMVSADGLVAYAATADTDLTHGPYTTFTPTLVSGGAGYVQGTTFTALATITVSGGTPLTNFSALAFNDWTESGGVINSLGSQGNIATNPFYLIPEPTNPATTTAGGPVGSSGGSGLTVNATFTQAWTNGPWTVSAGPTRQVNGTGYAAGEFFQPDTGNYQPYLNLKYSLLYGGVASVAGGVPSALTSGYKPDYNADQTVYSVAPTGVLGLTGASGSGATCTVTYISLGTCAPRLIKWDLVNAVILSETALNPFGSDDLAFGGMCVAANGDLYAINGKDTLHHINPSTLAVLGSYMAPFLGQNYTNPWQWAMGGWAIGGPRFNNPSLQPYVGWATVNIAAGTNRLYSSGDLDSIGRLFGVDVFDISAANPALLRSIISPVQEGDQGGFQVSGGFDLSQPMVVQNSTDTLYAIMSGVPGSSSLLLYKAGPSDTIFTDVTPSSWISNAYTLNFGFAFDQTNNVLLVAFGETVAGTTLYAYSIPSVTQLWTASIANFVPMNCFPQNIVGGKWRVLVPTSGASNNRLIDYDTLTGTTTIVADYATSPELDTFSTEAQGWGWGNFTAITVDDAESVYWMPVDLWDDSAPFTHGAINQAVQIVNASPPPPPPPPPPPFTCWPIPAVTGTNPLSNTIPAQPYVQYNDDPAIQAFFTAYNNLTQQYLNAFNSLNLPIYPLLSGNLLDWVAAGLYGFTRPTLVSGTLPRLGALDTQAFNTVPFNTDYHTGKLVYTPVSDDIFKRIITWHFYKGDGTNFDIRWLKRRIARFLFAAPGCLNPNIDQTYQISILFGAGNIVYINLVETVYEFLPTSLFNTAPFNTQPFEGKPTIVTRYPPIALAQVFKDCVNGGFLELPFQYDWIVNIIG